MLCIWCSVVEKNIVDISGWGGLVWHNLLMVRKKQKVIGQDSKAPPASLEVLMKHTGVHEQWVSNSSELYWGLLDHIWADNRPTTYRQSSYSQLSQRPFFLPKTWGIFVSGCSIFQHPFYLTLLQLVQLHAGIPSAKNHCGYKPSYGRYTNRNTAQLRQYL